VSMIQNGVLTGWQLVRWPLLWGLLAALVYLQWQSRQLPPVDAPVAAPLVESYAEAVSQAAPAVVNIYTRRQFSRQRQPLAEDPLYRHFFNNADSSRQERMQSALGSGVLVTASGYLVTNYHVIQGADEILVQLQDGREAQADIVGVDRENDLAVLKIALDRLTAIALRSGPELQVGDVVLAVGNPFGMGQTVTQGIVSAVGRYGLGINTFENFIQTDAAINPGNSGGALIDAKGRLVGINTAMLDRIGNSSLNGVGLAVPVATVQQSLNDILEFGRVVRGWLGVTAQPLTPELIARYKLPALSGLLVTGLYTNGPAHAAGIAPGDIITAVNGERMAAGLQAGLRSMQAVQESRPGQALALQVYRRGQTLELTAIVSVNPLTQDATSATRP
jgi:serine protease DegS